jgi:hypothetical protein
MEEIKCLEHSYLGVHYSGGNNGVKCKTESAGNVWFACIFS